jgi:hypothetical protein
MTGSDFFYQACDKYGIMVWDDFWLANPADGPEPNDEAMFMQNARDKIKRVRNHPSVAFYCGRNEGNPPETLNTALKNAVAELDPTRIYIPHSADGTVSGFGPYAVKDPKWYFQNRTSRKLHSEIGQPNMPSAESMRAMLPSDKQWPINDMWGIHDFCSNSAQGATEYQVAVRKYGIPASLDEFCRQAQMVNMENHKAMFESFVSAKANGALMWMSQSAWPSTVWQTYDYYLEQTAGYYGCKKASEPLHIFMDAYYNSIKVANNTGETHTNLTAEAALYNLDGSLLYTKEANIASIDDEVKSCLTLSFPDTVSDVHFIKLKLWKNDQLIDENFYWRGKEYQNYSSLRNMEKIIPGGGLKDSVAGKSHHITARITNPTSGIALMLRLKVLRNVSGERVLPVFYSDNYFSLLPGESKIVSLEFDDKYLAGEKAKLMLEGWNVDLMEITGPLASIEVVSKPAPGNGISVYPNPTRQWLHVKGMKKFDVSVFDTRGSRVLYKTRQNDTIDLSPLPSGNYVVQLVSGAKRFSASVVKL